MDFSSIKISEGISEKQIKQLLDYTNQDPEIRKFTSDLSRFPNMEAFSKWQEGKYLFTISDKEGDLLGLIWFEKKRLPEDIKTKDYQFTIAIRTYARARGKGLFKPFLEEAIKRFKSLEEYKLVKPKGFWVSIASENLLSQNAFLSFGFKKLDNPQNQKRVFMIYE